MFILKKTAIERTSGQGIIEYVLIIVLVAIAALLALNVMGISTREVFCSTAQLLGGSPASCQEDIVLDERFDSLDAWSFTVGSGWQAEDGKLCINRDGEHRGFSGDTGWDNYTIRVRMAELLQGNGYGVYFRVTNEPSINGYAFQYDPGYRGGQYTNGAFLIRRVTNGSETPPIAVAAAPADWQWTDISREIVIEVDGDVFTAYIDGNQVLQGRDSTYPTGRIGLRSWSTSRACFDDLSVTIP